MIVRLSNRKNLKFNKNDTIVLNDNSICKVSKSKGKRIKTILKNTNDSLGLFVKLGFIQGDGCLGRLSSKYHNGLELNIGYKDDDILSLFTLEKIENCRSYYVNGYNEILTKEGFSSNNLPTRMFPLRYREWNLEEKLDFIKGCYSANGSIIKTYRISYKNTCKEFTNQLKDALLEFGISANITINKPKKVKFSNGEYLCKESYDININKFEDVLIFYEKIGFVQNYKMKDLVDLIDIKSPKIMTIITSTSPPSPKELTNNEKV